MYSQLLRNIQSYIIEHDTSTRISLLVLVKKTEGSGTKHPCNFLPCGSKAVSATERQTFLHLCERLQITSSSDYLIQSYVRQKCIAPSSRDNVRRTRQKQPRQPSPFLVSLLDQRLCTAEHNQAKPTVSSKETKDR
ncbi:uncharacterized protein LOC126892866 [Diabrotica virgifera virgifera]|uniref:Uncharacterized protein n=1 Tax=Diabrotica virgifera virgifera TaxID=50390 RepID=A0ABM5L880_DIAVI|nr:uncharacterized protein LOC126892866 [Diabrotica virgifera virgifera]XP_050518639.1 uncharacterized protein LOC126892866 [Diabrotica virgifera virgifera]XP_050518640.1 uncharacterized protein LOC126892866 [Diabrotica virgifera virgifera]XP_050518641.1 uncharacterized protein LOC126892866 [Diabrotica virgifera virgifera]XP_050518642.1 uncharacterized protein LOC126892866 [Diabrotica virgifera virgifera]